MVLSCNKLTDDELVAKLRSCFSHALTMNEARGELQNMKQMEHESVQYICTDGEELSINHWESDLTIRDTPMSSRISYHP